MWALLTGFLHLIPGFTNLAQSVVTTVYNSKVAMYQARWGVTRDVAVTAIQAAAQDNQTKVSWLQAVAASPVFSFIVLGFATPWIIYEWKTVVYDNVWAHWGEYSTPEIKGLVAQWAWLILSGIFVTSGGVGIAHLVINKKDT